MKTNIIYVVYNKYDLFYYVVSKNYSERAMLAVRCLERPGTEE